MVSKRTRQVGIVTQARMGSTRLPGKILLSAANKPLLAYHIQRLLWSNLPVYVATTDQEAETPILQFCTQYSLPVYRGGEQDVLARFYEAACYFKLDVIVRVTSDCPLIDGHLIQEGLQMFSASPAEKKYLSNSLERTFPRGFDFEIFSFELLKEAYEHASHQYEREHVTPYMYLRNLPDVQLISFKQAQDQSRYRITLDVPEDYELIKRLIAEHHAEDMNHIQITGILEANPDLSDINSHVEQKKL
ncbi:MAG: glycosyltransferase family protein [Candidatus Sericytochromatia bacterium]|nr:glycosyltransferase family protein [Candidatus Sericytochromatia bacterium]